jgi:dienelactone hydrolase
MLRFVLCAVAMAAALSVHRPAAARPFTVDDLLHQESFGAAGIDPSGRWFVFEQRGRYDQARRFDNFSETSRTLGRLRIVDLRHPSMSKSLLGKDVGPGLVIGPFSPSGRRLAVYRLQGHHWSMGVVDLPRGSARWFALTPEEEHGGRSLAWISDRRLVVIERPDGMPPVVGQLGWIAAERLPKYWADAARGIGAHTVLGSGAYASLRVRPPARRLLEVDAVTGRRRQLATGQFFDLEPSPDHRRLALFESGPDLQVHGDAPVRGPAGLETEASRLTVLDLASGVARPVCPRCDFLPQLLTWSPDSSGLIALSRGPDGLWTSGTFVRVDSRTGADTVLGEGLAAYAESNPVRVHAGWLGGQPVVLARRATDSGARYDWFRLGGEVPVNLSGMLPPPDNDILASGRDSIVISAGSHLWRLRPGAVPQGLSSPAFTRTPPVGEVGFRLGVQPHPGTWLRLGGAVAWLDETGLRRPLPLPSELGDLIGGDPASGVLVTREADPRGLRRIHVLGSGGASTVVAVVNQPLAQTDAPRAVAVHHSGQRGEGLTSWVFLPRDIIGSPPPLIVRPYLGGAYPRQPHDPEMEPGFLQNLRVLTGHGYAVLVPSLPNPPQGMTDPSDHLAARLDIIIAAAAREPELKGAFDPDRVALLGWSFGGYTVMAAITQTDRYRAAVEIDGISDMTAYWAHIGNAHIVSPEIGYGTNWTTGGVEATQPQLGAPPWADPDRYHRNSPLLFADRIKTPLLLIHGALDTIPSAGSEAMYSALFRQGKDAMLVTYWGAVHELTSPGDLRDVYGRTFQFLDEHLAR